MTIKSDVGECTSKLSRASYPKAFDSVVKNTSWNIGYKDLGKPNPYRLIIASLDATVKWTILVVSVSVTLEVA